MNTREANAIAEVLRQIDHGPGDGWRAFLHGGSGLDPGVDGKGLEMRLADFQLWRDTWIRPALVAVVGRYFKPRRRRGALGSPGASKSGARFRAVLLEGMRKEASGAEEAPYWIGFYKSIAQRAVERVEELEAEGRS